MKLTRFQRNSIFAGNAPSLTGTGKPPVAKGDQIVLSSKVKLTVLRVDTTRTISGERWQLHYLIDDKRDPTRLIRRTPPVAHHTRANFDEHGYPLRIPEGEASEESSYTAAGASAIPDAGEAPPRGWVEEQAKQRRLRDLGKHDPGRSLAIQLKEAAKRAHRQGVDVSPELARLREELDGLLRKLDEAA